MYNSMCFRVHFTSISTVVFFIFQRTVHPRVLYFRELFTPGFYTSENCSPQGIIFQRTVHPRFLYFRELFTPVFIFQRTFHPRFLYFRELFTPGFYIAENCSTPGFSGQGNNKLPNSEQSYKGKVKTHNYINRQNQSAIGKL